MEFTEVVKNRYSCKKFNDSKITAQQLNEILEAGRLAPTAKNLQEQPHLCCSIRRRLSKNR